MSEADTSVSVVGDPKRDGRPFLRPKNWPKGELTGQGPIEPVSEPGAAPSVLALHGFTATPNEVLMLTELGAELGLRRSAPLLPGHGTHARDLAQTRYADWYAVAASEFERLSEHGPVVVGGQSMGAVLALDLASRHPGRVAGVVALAAATRLTSPFPNLGLALVGALRADRWFMPKFGGPNMRDDASKHTHVTYDSQPIAAAIELRKAGLRVLDRVQYISCPVFVAHGQHDGVCPVSNAWELASRLGTPDVELLILGDSAHILTKDRDRALLRARLGAFLRRVTGSAAVQRPVEP